MFKSILAVFTGPAGIVGGWFASLWGKVIGILAILGVITVTLGLIYFSFKDSIQEAAEAKFTIQQQKTLVKEKDVELKRLQDLDKLKDSSEAAQAQATKSAQDKSQEVQDWIKSNGTGSVDRVSSDVITQTFDKIYGKAKAK